MKGNDLTSILVIEFTIHNQKLVEVLQSDTVHYLFNTPR